MKYPILSLLMFGMFVTLWTVPAVASDESLCESVGYDVSVVLSEDFYSAQEGFKAFEFLESIREGSEFAYSFLRIQRANVLIEGYKLKESARDSMVNTRVGDSLEVIEFCEYVKNNAPILSTLTHK